MKKPKRVVKPWGWEDWLEHNDWYCFKVILIKAGTRTSFQYHEIKHETNYIISGNADLLLENENGQMETHRVGPGDSFVIEPPRRHRFVAITDLLLAEASTPQVNDVIRIEDDSGRPDGKIDAEHQS